MESERTVEVKKGDTMKVVIGEEVYIVDVLCTTRDTSNNVVIVADMKGKGSANNSGG